MKTVFSTAAKMGVIFASILAIQASAQTNCAPPPSGLVSWWRAEGTAVDEVGVNDGEWVGNAAYTNGMVGQGFLFDGINSFVKVPHDPTLNFSNALTVELWFKDLGSFEEFYALVAKRDRANDGGPINFGINVEPGGSHGVQIYFNDPTIGSHETSNYLPVPATGVFHHFAATLQQVDATQVRIGTFIDGTMVKTQVVTASLAKAVNEVAVTIGAATPTAGEMFKGVIDEVSLYDRALTPIEVQSIYDAGATGKCVNPVAPMITSQPTNQTLLVGGTANFTITASGTSPLSYQWRLNGTNIAGATSTLLKLTDVQLTNAGAYSVIVSNSVGTTPSSNAVLTVDEPVCVTPPTNLISWWRAETDAADSVGSNNGILSNGVTFVAGRVGQAFNFTGVNSFVQVPNSASLSLSNEFTLDLWFKDTGSSSTVGLMAKRPSSGACNFGINMSPGGAGTLQVYFLDPLAGGNFQLSSYSPLPPAGGFHHLATTFQQVNSTQVEIKIFIDGICVKTDTFDAKLARSVNTTPVTLGCSHPVGGEYFKGVIDEAAIYGRALSTNEIQAIYNAGAAGKCVVPIAPFIVSHPTNGTVTVGGTANFNVVAGGTQPLSYQWLFNSTNLPGATTSSLTLTNIQINQAGNYSVVITNEGGSAISSNALLTVNFPPALVRVANTNAASASTVVVPVLLAANGNENALGFSLNFSTSRLAYASVSLGSGLGAATLFVNDSQAGSGKLGLALSLPAGNTLPAGTQAVALVTFTTAVVTNVSATTLSFGDSPIVRQLVDAPGNPLPANYASGTVTIAAVEFEGDVSPRPVGDRLLTIADWVLVGRYAARLDYPTNATEFQRADCAPRGSLGNGRIRVGDWVQAGRYAAGLDSGTPLGGPTSEDSGAMAKLSGPIPAAGPNGGGALRQVRVANVALAQNQTGVVPVHLESQGDENALGFSLTFDPATFSYVGTSVGGGASGATLNVNTSQVGAGKLGVVLALAPGSHFAAGTQEIVKVSLRAAAGATNGNPVTFANDPVPQEVTDATAVELTADYINGTVIVNPPPTLQIARAGQDVRLSWPLWASNFTPQVMDALATPPAWTNVSGTVGVSGEENVLTLPLTSNTKFYRLVSP